MTVHYTEKYLLNPAHKVTVNLVGLGGTGSQMLTSLARLSETLKALGHPGLHVRAWDPDEVTAANLGRQLFSPADVGQKKVISLISRINRYFGLDWEARPTLFKNQQRANILVTCIDTAAGRIAIAEGLDPKKTGDVTGFPYYWLDLGNLQKTGQVILGTVGSIGQPKTELTTQASLPNVVKKFPQLKKIKEKDQGPSCSLLEAIGKQDLFINSTLAQFGAGLIWKLFREGMIRHHGCFVNLDTYQVSPIPIK
jgi:PRTRC genetic system ThiF family protein